MTRRRKDGGAFGSQPPSKEYFLTSIYRRKTELESSDWLQTALDTVKDVKIDRIRCLALGEPSEWPNAQYQLAFLVLLSQSTGVAPENVTVFDPLFKDIDREIVESFGFSVTSEDPADAGTLWYMPHAPLSLFLGLIGSITVYIGNDMTEFVPRVKLTTQQQAQLDTLKFEATKPIPVAKTSRWFLAMSELAFHRFA